MKLIDRIKLASSVILKGHTYDINDMWLRGQHPGDVGLAVGHQGGDIASAYKSCSVAYACIDRIAKDVSGIPLVFLRDPEDIESDVSDTDPLRMLFTQPAKGISTRRLIGWSVMMRQLRGEVIWKLDRSGRTVRSINPWIDPLQWKEHVSKDAGLYQWTYRDRQNEVMVPADQVLWIGQDNPSNPYRGQSPLKAAADSLRIIEHGKSLTADMLGRGGERGLVLSTDVSLQQEQYEQLLQNLARRRPGGGQSTRDMIFDNGLKLENPSLTKEDIDTLAWLNAAKDDICQVYGMAPVLIGDDDAAQYKSAPEAIKLYWQQAITPLVRSLEDAFDGYFTEFLGMGTHVRFDLSKVKALQRDELEKAQIANVYSQMGVSLVAINAKLGLGFDDADMTLADEANAYVPPIPEPVQQQQEPAKSLHKGLTNDLIRKRAESLVFKAGRVRRRNNLERSMWNSYKAIAGTYKAKTEDVVREAVQLYGMTDRAINEVTRALYDMQAKLGNDLVEATAPAHREAIQLGQASIQELVDGKAMPWHDRVKFLSIVVNVDEIMARRGRYIRANIATALIDRVNDSVREIITAAAEDGESVGWIVSRLGDAFAGWATGQAKTIARTEIGTAYNTGRFAEMDAQGFQHHQWLTSLDDATRGPEDEFDHERCNDEVRGVGETFSCGLEYPQQDGGDAGNVINCRCETIPFVKD